MLSNGIAEAVYGTRTMNQVLEDKVRQDPNRIYGWVPKTDVLADGFNVITYMELLNSVHVAAHWLDQHLGVLPQIPADRETVAYLGSDDLGYAILLLAADRTNRTLLMPLAANSAEAQARLIDLSNTKALLATEHRVQCWANVTAVRPHLKVTEVPNYTFFTKGKASSYPYDQPLADFWHSSPFAIQTSGTTGQPKPIPHSNAALSTLDYSPRPWNVGSQVWGGRTNVVTLPQSWIVGIYLALTAPLFVDAIPIMLPATVQLPPSLDQLKLVKALVPSFDAAFILPHAICNIYQESGGPEFFASLKFLAYGGAALDPNVGDLIAKSTNIIGTMGSTEGGVVPRFVSADPAEWQWFHIDLSVEFYLEPFSHDLYELCISKIPDHPRPIFTMDPTIEVYRTADLFRQHPNPAKTHLWQPVGRADDFVKLQNMTKFNAVSIERVLDNSPAINRSVVGGADKPYSFAILQPAGQHASAAAAIDAMWPAIEAVNTTIYKDAKLRKDKLIVADPNRPFGTTQKGTTSRRAAINAYTTEIESLYQ